MSFIKQRTITFGSEIEVSVHPMTIRQLNASKQLLNEANCHLVPEPPLEVDWYPQTLSDLDLLGTTLIDCH